jgi:hypothetical protein
VDLTELRYRELAAKFIRLAQRTTSTELANTFLDLARHYDSLAKIHAKYQKISDASVPVPGSERNDGGNAT